MCRRKGDSLMIRFDVAAQTFVWLHEQRNRGDVSGGRLQYVPIHIPIDRSQRLTVRTLLVAISDKQCHSHTIHHVLTQ